MVQVHAFGTGNARHTKLSGYLLQSSLLMRSNSVAFRVACVDPLPQGEGRLRSWPAADILPLADFCAKAQVRPGAWLGLAWLGLAWQILADVPGAGACSPRTRRRLGCAHAACGQWACGPGRCVAALTCMCGGQSANKRPRQDVLIDSLNGLPLKDAPPDFLEAVPKIRPLAADGACLLPCARACPWRVGCACWCCAPVTTPCLLTC